MDNKKGKGNKLRVCIGLPLDLRKSLHFLSKIHKWKPPGSDKLPSYWVRAFPATHSYNTKIFNTIIEKPQLMPDWLGKGITSLYLLPK
jgi:hypothetical protein